MTIHPMAIVDPAAELGADVEVGPFSIIEAGVRIGDGTRIGPHCVIKSGVTLGRNCTLDVGVVLGSEPQDKKFQGEQSFVRIGDNNLLREYVTIHRATGAGLITQVGDDNFLMAYAHLGHNTRVGNGTSIASFVGIGGHVTIGDRVIIGGVTGIHQYTTIGRMVMVGGCSRVNRDIPPFCIGVGNPIEIAGINVIGLARNDVSEEQRQELRNAYRAIYRSDRNTSDAIAELRASGPLSAMVEEFVEFIERIDEGHKGRQGN